MGQKLVFERSFDFTPAKSEKNLKKMCEKLGIIEIIFFTFEITQTQITF